MEEFYILGTAGHIDHGKTELTKALTKIDTDRLVEEKKRGISIDLGFAYIDLDEEKRIGVVDVPGHERFIKNMLAGATGIDIVLFVIAADEGVMPQSVEHLNICDLLSIKSGIIVLTKVDLVDDEWLDLVESDVREFIKGTFLENTPIIKTSVKTGQGINQLRDVIIKLVGNLKRESNTSIFRFPIDRIFSIKGFGTVVTGTVISGSVKKEKDVELLPSRKKVRIRGLQVHHLEKDKIHTGQRGALNLASIEKEDIERGNILADIDRLIPSRRITALLKMVRDTDYILKNRARIRFHIGTSEIIARITILGGDKVSAGEEIPIQVLLEKPICCLRGDRFVIRAYSPSRTVGGGVVIEPSAEKIKRNDQTIGEKVRVFLSGKDLDIAEYYIIDKSDKLTGISDLNYLFNYDNEKVKKVEKELGNSKTIFKLTSKDGYFYISKNSYESLCNEIFNIIAKYHENNPLKPGFPKEELKSRFLRNHKLLSLEPLLQNLLNKDKLIVSNQFLSLPDFEQKLSSGDKKTQLEIINLFKVNPTKPPDFKQLVNDNRVNRKVLDYMISSGIITKVTSGILFLTQTLDEIEGDIKIYFQNNKSLDISSFKSIFDTSRKYIIPLLEYFDQKGLTHRSGNERILKVNLKKPTVNKD